MLSERERIDTSVENLVDFEIAISNTTKLNVKINIECTMFDGKVVNALTDTNSTQSCNICKAKPSEMNRLELVRSKETSEDAMKLGVSSLHSWIRTFDYLLHLGYKKNIKEYYARTPEQKQNVSETKKEIQKRFREELSLVVDMPKQGFGNTNTGNVARRAFENAEVFASIVGVEEEVIIRLRTILRALCSGYHLETEAYKDYCLRTAEMLVENYGWYILPPTVHKLLEHSYAIAEHLELPIGSYSEEAQEAQNKELRKARLDHSCKVSRLNVMKNQMHYMLTRTDPVISSKSFKKYRTIQGSPIDLEVQKLLRMEEV